MTRTPRISHAGRPPPAYSTAQCVRQPNSCSPVGRSCLTPTDSPPDKIDVPPGTSLSGSRFDLGCRLPRGDRHRRPQVSRRLAPPNPRACLPLTESQGARSGRRCDSKRSFAALEAGPMTRPFPNDLRERVVRIHQDGEPIRSVTARCWVSASSAPTLTAHYRATASWPLPHWAHEFLSGNSPATGGPTFMEPISTTDRYGLVPPMNIPMKLPSVPPSVANSPPCVPATTRG